MVYTLPYAVNIDLDEIEQTDNSPHFEQKPRYDFSPRLNGNGLKPLNGHSLEPFVSTFLGSLVREDFHTADQDYARLVEVIATNGSQREDIEYVTGRLEEFVWYAKIKELKELAKETLMASSRLPKSVKEFVDDLKRFQIRARSLEAMLQQH